MNGISMNIYVTWLYVTWDVLIYSPFTFSSNICGNMPIVGVLVIGNTLSGTQANSWCIQVRIWWAVILWRDKSKISYITIHLGYFETSACKLCVLYVIGYPQLFQIVYDVHALSNNVSVLAMPWYSVLSMSTYLSVQQIAVVYSNLLIWY